MENSQLTVLSQIIHHAALKHSSAAQADYILAKITEALRVDVCTVYRRQTDDSLALAYTHGLNKAHPTTIPHGKGLVSTVLQTQKTLNIIEPSNRPDFYLLARSNETGLHSFCGVPIFSKGEVSGVLVVQRYQPNLLEDDQLAVLNTLAIHLGLLLPVLPDDTNSQSTKNIVVKGISGAPGLAIGQAYRTSSNSLFDTEKRTVEDIQKTLRDWSELKLKAKANFQTERSKLQSHMGEQYSSLIDAYSLMLDDPMLDGRVQEEISNGAWLPWALKAAVTQVSDLFQALDDPYLSARHEDVEQLGETLFNLWSNTHQDLKQSSEPIVLIGKNISVSTITQLLEHELVGIISTEGAALSHIAIFANALNIPAIMGTGNIKGDLDKTVIVDGDSGQAIINPSTNLIREYRKSISDKRLLSKALLENTFAPTISRDGKTFSILANSGLSSDIEPGLGVGAEGIGLYRSELLFMLQSNLPSEQDQHNYYRQVLAKYKGMPVYIRTLDVGSDKPLPYLPRIHEENPALGLRGIRFTLANLTILDTQLRAILRASANLNNLHVIFPMISTTEQLDQSISAIEKNIEALKDEGLTIPRPKIGIMLEVPAALSMLPLWAQKIDFISIGSNDLSQYLLATDRNNALVQNCFDHFHPTLLHELNRIADICRHEELPFSICGEIASIPLYAVYLIAMGYEQFSLSATKIPLIKELIRNIDTRSAQQVLRQAFSMDKAKDIRHASELFTKSLKLPFENLIL